MVLSQGQRDYAAGIVSGWAKVLAGHPFDTIKIRMQLNPVYKNSFDCLLKMIRTEGAMSLYNGMAAPLLNVGIIGGLLFYSNGAIHRMICNVEGLKDREIASRAVAGCGAGVLVGFITVPAEVIKTRLQMRNKNIQRGNVMTVRDAFRGFTPTMIREIGTFGIFFPVNYYLRCRFSPTGLERDVTLGWKIMAAGLGGAICWIPCFPIDVVKSHMQVAPSGSYRSTLHAVAAVYRMRGLSGFWKGITPCAVRAYPAYAAQYIAYEYVSLWL